MPRKILVSLSFLFLAPAAFPQTPPPLSFGPEVVVGPKMAGSSHDVDTRGSVVASADGAVVFFLHKEHQGALESSVRAVRIGKDGRPDPASLRILVPSVSTHYQPVAARSGNGFVLVWPSSGSLFASRVDADLTLRDPNGILLGSGGRSRIACDDSRCAVAANNRVILLDAATAAPIASTTVAASSSVNSEVVRAGGGTFVVTWTDYDTAAISLHAARVNAAGSVEGPWLLDSGTTLFGPAADFDGSGAVIVWAANRELRGTRIGSLGEPAPAKTISTLGENDFVSAIGWNGHQHLAVISRVIPPGGPVIGGFVPTMLLFGRPLDASLNPAGGEVPISTMPAVNSPPDLTAIGTDFVLVWDYGESNLSTATALRTIVIAEDGTPRGGDPAEGGSPLFTGPVTQAPMAVASSSDAYLGVWFAHDTPAAQHLYAARASASGQVLDAPIALTSGRGIISAAAASDGRDFLVVWYDIDSDSYQHPRFMVARIDGFDGSVTTTQLSPDMMLPPGATVRWDGSAYVVAVRELDRGLHLLRLAPDGSLVSDSALESSEPLTRSFPYRVASSGDRTLVVWSAGEATNCTNDCVGTFAAVYDSSGHFVAQPHRLFAPAVTMTLAVRDSDFLMVNTLTNGSVQALRIARDGSASPAVKLGEWQAAYYDLLLAPLAGRWLVIWDGKPGRQFTRWDPDFGTALPPGLFPFAAPMLLAKGLAGKAVMTYASDNAVILREIDEPSYARRRGAIH